MISNLEPDYLFVYGTLRPGQPLWSMLAPCLKEPPVKAYLPGFRLHCPTWGTFPYMTVSYQSADIVRGSLVKIADRDAIFPILRMELRAGYDAWEVQPTAKPDGGAKLPVATAFVFPKERRTMAGAELEQFPEEKTGILVYDWVQWRNRKLRAYADEVETFPRYI